MSIEKKISLIGYSGHAYVVADILISMGIEIIGYCESTKKENNPYNLKYLGSEKNSEVLKNIANYFVAIGDNNTRKIVSEYLIEKVGLPQKIFHSTSIVSNQSTIESGVMIAPAAIVNSGSIIYNGVIINSGSIIEHECIVHQYAHIAPGSILCGNVTIGENTLVGAGSVVLPGIKIGKNVIVGAGSVVTKNIPNDCKIVGNPARII